MDDYTTKSTSEKIALLQILLFDLIHDVKTRLINLAYEKGASQSEVARALGVSQFLISRDYRKIKKEKEIE